MGMESYDISVTCEVETTDPTTSDVDYINVLCEGTYYLHSDSDTDQSSGDWEDLKFYLPTKECLNEKEFQLRFGNKELQSTLAYMEKQI